MEHRRVLDSWKEISAYLNRSVMTCQRWEKDLELPVHRLDGTPRARVFAYPDELDRWLAEKLHVAEVSGGTPVQHARPGRKRALIAVASVILLTVIGGAAWRFFLRVPVHAPAQVPSLAILPFENRTGDQAWDAWKTALPDLMTIDLRQSKFLDVIKTSSTYQFVGPLAEADTFSAEDLKKVAEKAQVGYAVTGSISKAGEDIVFTAFVHDANTGDLLGSPRMTCRAEKEVFSCTDDLSGEIKIALNVKPRDIRGDIDKPVARITTASPQAFRLFSQAYRLQGRSSFGEAISPLLEAVEIDPGFGLAYWVLSRACGAVSRDQESKRYCEMAVRLADRIEERERSIILATWHESERPGKKKKVQAYQRLGKNYPYDITMTGLASEYASQEEWDKAIPVLEKMILRYPQRISVVRALSDGYRSVGRYGEAEKLIDDRLGPGPRPGKDTSSLLSIRYRLALSQKKFDAAHDCVERMKTAGIDISSYCSQKGFIYFMQDDLASAEKIYQKMVESDNMRIQVSGFQYLAAVSLSRGRIEEAKQRTLRAIELLMGLEDYGAPMEMPLRHLLAYLERLSGRLPEALKEIELACGTGENTGLVQVVPVIYLRALITLEMNRFDEFEKQVEEIREYLDPDRFPFGASRYMRVYYNLLGHRELKKKNYDMAIQYFWKALDLLSPLGANSIDGEHAKYFYDLGEAYRLAGSLTEAVTQYEKVVLPTVSREFSGDLYSKSYYWMGLDHERWMLSTAIPALAKERRLKAAGYYRKFLDLWGNADPIFPEVEDARQRLSRLNSRQEPPPLPRRRKPQDTTIRNNFP